MYESNVTVCVGSLLVPKNVTQKWKEAVHNVIPVVAVWSVIDGHAGTARAQQREGKARICNLLLQMLMHRKPQQ